MFLNGPDTQTHLKALISQSSTVKFAVAFWGQPAPEILGLLARQGSIQVICNLQMGGTNPDAVIALQAAGIDVVQSDHLHGKVYLFDDVAIVGSSNASANGLSLQAAEMSGWHEANILVTEPPTMAAISKWYQELPTRKITPADLNAAKDIWSRRRRAGLGKLPTSKTKLIDDLRKDPNLFKGRRLFICVYSEGLSPAGEKSLKFAERSNPNEDETVEGFEWPELPDFSDLLCFWNEKGHFLHDGLVHMPETRLEITKFGTKFQVCRVIKDIGGYSRARIGSVAAWTPALTKFAGNCGDKTGGFVDLGEFSEKYLR